jgi:hypothetical protein
MQVAEMMVPENEVMQVRIPKTPYAMFWSAR